MEGWHHLNRVLNTRTWEASRARSSHLGVCGVEFAKHQIDVGNHSVNEQPLGSDVYQLEAWVTLRADRRVVSAVFHQCQVGLVEGKSRLPVKKATELLASDERLVRRFRRLLRQGLRACRRRAHAEGSHVT
eukprot:572702-Pyramimonas_sp.AAC.1